MSRYRQPAWFREMKPTPVEETRGEAAMVPARNAARNNAVICTHRSKTDNGKIAVCNDCTVKLFRTRVRP